MNRNELLNRTGIVLFALTEAVLFGFSQSGMTKRVDSMHYLCIVLCLVFAVGYAFGNKPVGRSRGCILLGLLSTVIADYFLIIANNQYEYGVFLFFFTQFCYALFLTARWEKIEKCRRFTVRTIIAAMVTVAAVFVIKQFSILLLEVCFYVIYFIGNVRIAVLQFAKHRLFSTGLLLFFCCDICVGLTNLDVVGVENPLTTLCFSLIWVFYIPSQVCIAFSICRNSARNNT